MTVDSVVVSFFSSVLHSSIFNLIGLATVVICSVLLLLNIGRGVYVHFLAAGVDHRSYGKWAVVTGATDGIGLGYCKALARRHVDIILISRNEEKLTRVAAELRASYGIETKTIAVDFCSPPEQVLSILTGALDDDVLDDIGTLVNNVGMDKSPSFENYCASADDCGIDVVNCNVFSHLIVTRIVVPKMLERGRGVVISLSSIGGLVPCPGMSLYSASKAFVDLFARSLQVQYEGSGVLFQSVRPCGVSTNMYPDNESLLVVSAETFAESALRKVGAQRTSHGCLSHALQGLVLRWMPEWLLRPFSRLAVREMDDLKRRKPRELARV